MKIKILIILLLITSASYAQSIDTLKIREVNLSELFKGMKGTFVLLDKNSNTLIVHDTSRMKEAFLPASTFKIPNTVIGLEEGILKDDSTVIITWDSAEVSWKSRWPESWKKAQTLESAFRNSVVWYYQRLAKIIGADRMQKYLNRFDYGNKNIGGGIDQFWLDGDIRISPIGQIIFLDKLFNGDFEVRESTLKTLYRIMKLKQTEEYTIFGKTGTATLTDEVYLGWLVGFIEKNDSRYYYALNIEGDTVWEEWPPHKRVELLEKILMIPDFRFQIPK
jgi:beta-lactamase class D